jgi:DNA-binding CsgD family transcriptional regulator/tetratricopeptide (TPR) repeat protein
LGEAADDPFATSYALVTQWLAHSVRRDHDNALTLIDRAIGVLGDGPDHGDLRAVLRDSRIFTLQNLDRWPEAEATLRRARELAQHDGLRGASQSVAAAVLMFWLGRWDDAMAELAPVHQDLAELTYAGLRERGQASLWHGIGALIAARRNDRVSAASSLEAGHSTPMRTPAERENGDFLIMAGAVLAEQAGDQGRALSILSTLERRPGEMTLIHQWLPDVVRLALAVGDDDAALAAVQTCRAEAAAESTPARATAAARRCAGLLTCDPAELRHAVAHYRTVGPALELAGALEDLAVVLAAQGEAEEAKLAFNEAADHYTGFGATWDISRGERRLRAFGLRRGVRGPRRPRGATGWAALSPTELKIASQISLGLSTPKIADDMFLSRRTVQSHIASILKKLGARSRVDIARAAFHQETQRDLSPAE